MKKVLGASFVVVFGVMLSVSASADEKVLPGLSCVKVGTAGTAEVDGWGKMRNQSSGETMRLLCPIVKDDAPWSVDRVRVRGLDLTTVGQVACAIGATEADRDVIYWSATVRSGGTGNNLFAGWYDLLLTPPTVQESGSVIVDCVLPPTQAGNASSIVSVYWDET
ncbi:hypothetical protein [Sorangium sp. So ce1182]|uniref:hypothetical protein n=1 Tax=Sorangium sp. So ce1182 TaxID=3133334 RepID=UPI003F629260